MTTRGTLAGLLADRFGVDAFAVVNPVIASIGTTPAIFLRNNPNRLGFWLVNLSPNVMYAGPFPDASPSKGIAVGANGGNLSLLWVEDFLIVGWEWQIVSTAAASSFLVIEFLTGEKAASPSPAGG